MVREIVSFVSNAHTRFAKRASKRGPRAKARALCGIGTGTAESSRTTGKSRVR